MNYNPPLRAFYILSALYYQDKGIQVESRPKLCGWRKKNVLCGLNLHKLPEKENYAEPCQGTDGVETDMFVKKKLSPTADM